MAGSELDPTSQELAAWGPEVDQLGELRQKRAASTFLITALLQAFLHPTFML